MQAILSRTTQWGGLARRECCSSGRTRPLALAQRLEARLPRRCALRIFAQQRQPTHHPDGSAALSSTDLESSRYSPFAEPLLRSFILGVGTGALLEAGHVALQVLTGSFPGVAEFSPLLVADHVTAFAAWIALYAIEATAVMQVLRRFNGDRQAAAGDLRRLTTLPKRMLPHLRMALFRRLVAWRAGKAAAAGSASAFVTSSTDEEAGAATTSTAPAPPRISPPTRAGGRSTIVPLPRTLRRGGPAPAPAPVPTVEPETHDTEAGRLAKRQKELRDRQGYLRNVWYAVALSSKLGRRPLRVQLCGKEMVLFRGQDGAVHCLDNACPHRGAPLSEGWVAEREGHDCIVCPYHGWALDCEGSLRDVPAAENKGEWPKRALVDAYPVEERGGFVWLFFGSCTLPAEARPPIPHIPELEHPEWKPVYEEMEFDCNHFGVFENAVDMAHIHYLHADSFGNQNKPEIHDMQATSDAYSVTATFRIHNKPVNAFWALFQVPEVHVTATAFLPSTSVVSFTLGNAVSFITFVNTVPLSANRSVNRFALVRNLAWDRSGLFNATLWDGWARQAMLKILGEDKAMVEQLKYDQLPAEYSVRADLPQVMFRRLRQQWVDLGYGIPTEEEAFAIHPAREGDALPPDAPRGQ